MTSSPLFLSSFFNIHLGFFFFHLLSFNTLWKSVWCRFSQGVGVCCFGPDWNTGDERGVSCLFFYVIPSWVYGFWCISLGFCV